MGRRPIMEMIQQLFKLQISLSFPVATLSGPLSLLLSRCSLLAHCLFPCFPLPLPIFSLIVTTISLNSQGRELTASEEPDFLMYFLSPSLSLSLSYPSAELHAWLLASSHPINIPRVELCAALLVVPAGGGAQPDCCKVPRHWGLVCSWALSLPLLFRG